MKQGRAGSRKRRDDDSAVSSGAERRKATSALDPPRYGIGFLDRIPDRLRAGIESLTGVDVGDVRVHRNSDQPARYNARAFTLGNEIHVAAGEEQRLPHEAWHVVQQRQARVRPTRNAAGVRLNDEASLEREAEAMGREAVQPRATGSGQARHGEAPDVGAPGPAGTTASGGPVCMQRFESFEHVELGDVAGGASTGLVVLDCHTRDLPQHAAPVTTWPAAWQAYYRTLSPVQQRALTRGLTYGEIVALSGDMYADFQALNRAPLREVIDLIPLIRSTTATTQQFQAATAGRYLTLAAENIGHFSNVPIGQRNRDIWRRTHIQAIAAAQAGNANLAWGLNASADHFLTDSFSGGHIRVARARLHASGKAGDVTSKALHDLDNEFGVLVTNDRGDAPWIAYGDEHLGDRANARNRALALEAVQLSKQDIADALAQRGSSPAATATTVFAAERLIPFPVAGAPSRWNAVNMQMELTNLVASEAPGIASDLVGDDMRVRDWVNRMDVAALGRQSEADVMRMVLVLLSGVVTDDDMRAIERLLGSVTDPALMSRLSGALSPRAKDIGDFGLRMRFRIALGRTP